jgi:hypothetical protein
VCNAAVALIAVGVVLRVLAFLRREAFWAVGAFDERFSGYGCDELDWFYRARAQGYRENLVPQREEIVERTQEQVSYMLEGQFELLLVKQQEYDAYEGYLEAVRDYWLARADLAREVGTSLPSTAQTAGDVIGAEELTRPHDAGMGHEGVKMDHTDIRTQEPNRRSAMTTRRACCLDGTGVARRPRSSLARPATPSTGHNSQNRRKQRDFQTDIPSEGERLRPCAHVEWVDAAVSREGWRQEFHLVAEE